MISKQLSVFVENRKGRLEEVLNVLKENGINILSLSLADTTEYGLLRLIVNDCNKGKEALTKSGFSTLLSDILIIKISNISGSLDETLKVLSKNDISVEYMYGLSVDGTKASIVIKTNDILKTDGIFTANKIETIGIEEI
ncbi:MAG: ACT domain-containing protein [Clostridia bacterium]|nr:ACT domain-containing protein [Clostridia bacterium]